MGRVGIEPTTLGLKASDKRQFGAVSYRESTTYGIATLVSARWRSCALLLRL
jgi:hypothetical protein